MKHLPPVGRLFLGVAWLCVIADSRADAPLVFRGARILTAADKNFDPGTLVVQDGKILAVGPLESVPIPEGATLIDAAGKVIIPGLVDTHSHLGLFPRPDAGGSDGNEMTGPVQSVVRAMDALNPFDPGIRMALAGGVTTANIMPGSGNVIGGQTIYVKLRGNSPQRMWIASDQVYGGLKMANGENPKRSYGNRGQAPATRMKIAALQRAEFIKAQEYQKKWDAYRKKLAAGEDVSPPGVDLNLEPLVEALQRKRTVHFHSHRADDILTLLRLQEEFGFELVLQHGTESFKIIEELARRKVPVSMTIVDSPGGKAEVVDFTEQCGAELHKAGVKVLVNTDDPVTESRFFLRTAAAAVRGGLPEDIALKAITLHGAQVMHLDQRLGSLEAGKDADFVVLSGPPFSVYTRVLQTYIEGQKVFDLADERQRLYQTGGFSVGDRGKVPPEKPAAKPFPPAAAPEVPQRAPRAKEGAKELLILAARLHTVARGTIFDGAVHVKEGKIVYAGPRKDFRLPENAPVATAVAVTPGLIDAHTSVPLSGQYNIMADQDLDENTDPNQADARVLDAFNPGEPLLQFLLRNGVTVVHVCPGRKNVIGGLSGVFRTHGRTADAMTVRFPQALVFNLGDVPKESYPGRRPGTRMGTAAMVRTALSEAANALRRKKEAKDSASAPERNLKEESFALVLEKKLPALFAAHRADDLLTALRISEEFKLECQLALATEGYLIADQIAKAGVPVIAHPTMQRVGSMETFHSFLGNAAALSDAKILVAIGCGFEGYVPKTRMVRYEAAMAVPHGLGFEAALRAVTLDAARILKIDDRFGSLEAGKTADLVLYDGDPFEHTTHVTHVVVDGTLVYDRSTAPPIPAAQRLFFNSPESGCCLEW